MAKETIKLGVPIDNSVIDSQQEATDIQQSPVITEQSAIANSYPKDATTTSVSITKDDLAFLLSKQSSPCMVFEQFRVSYIAT